MQLNLWAHIGSSTGLWSDGTKPSNIDLFWIGTSNTDHNALSADDALTNHNNVNIWHTFNMTE